MTVSASDDTGISHIQAYWLRPSENDIGDAINMHCPRDYGAYKLSDTGGTFTCSGDAVLNERHYSGVYKLNAVQLWSIYSDGFQNESTYVWDGTIGGYGRTGVAYQGGQTCCHSVNMPSITVTGNDVPSP